MNETSEHASVKIYRRINDLSQGSWFSHFVFALTMQRNVCKALQVCRHKPVHFVNLGSSVKPRLIMIRIVLHHCMAFNGMPTDALITGGDDSHIA